MLNVNINDIIYILYSNIIYLYLCLARKKFCLFSLSFSHLMLVCTSIQKLCNSDVFEHGRKRQVTSTCPTCNFHSLCNIIVLAFFVQRFPFFNSAIKWHRFYKCQLRHAYQCILLLNILLLNNDFLI